MVSAPMICPGLAIWFRCSATELPGYGDQFGARLEADPLESQGEMLPHGRGSSPECICDLLVGQTQAGVEEHLSLALRERPTQPALWFIALEQVEAPSVRVEAFDDGPPPANRPCQSASAVSGSARPSRVRAESMRRTAFRMASLDSLVASSSSPSSTSPRGDTMASGESPLARSSSLIPAPTWAATCW